MYGVIVENKNKNHFICENPDDIILKRGDKVIFSTDDDGFDFGEVLYTNVTLRKSSIYKLLRKATEDDIRRFERLIRLEEEAYDIFREKVKENNLEMKLVKVDFRYDKTKYLFYFKAEGRVDFRKLVRNLAAIYKTRIELRQIGVRDEAKLIGGIGMCGQELCCRRFLKEFQPIETNMAKIQDLMINPSKISGYCGKLMCCLAYEKDFYEKYRKYYPNIGDEYKTEKGEGVVKGVNILKGTILVEYEGRYQEEIKYEIPEEIIEE